jgi:N-glycosylase/DNA lyase
VLIPVTEPLDLTSTLLSGQAFRWRQDGLWFHCVIFGGIVKLREVTGGVELRCDPQAEGAIASLLRDYLGLGTDLEKVYETLLDDERLRESIHRYTGMRILRQDPWECLVSFICSSASNIPRITRNIEAMCTTFGRSVELDGLTRHTFPTPNDLAEAGSEALRGLGLGYRAEYVASTAETIANGKVDLMPLREDSYEVALETLTSLAGVGDKVANCVLLFSLDKSEAFPVDVWIERALQDWYLDGTKMSRKNMRPWASNHFGTYAGYANHYLFHDRRLKGRKSSA